jgi:hypothetical protein
MWNLVREVQRRLGDKNTSSTYDRSTDSLEAISENVTAGRYSTGTIVEDTSTGTPKVVDVTSSASANTFGSWTEIDASLAANSYIFSVIVGFGDDDSLATVHTVEIGTGASPTTIIRFSFAQEYKSRVGMYVPFQFCIPKAIYVVAGTAISARLSDNEANANPAKISVQYYNSL